MILVVAESYGQYASFMARMFPHHDSQREFHYVHQDALRNVWGTYKVRTPYLVLGRAVPGREFADRFVRLLVDEP